MNLKSRDDFLSYEEIAPKRDSLAMLFAYVQ